MLGAACMLLYGAVGVWMAAVAKRDPGRVFQIGRYGRIRRRDVTASEWIRRYLPSGLGGGLLLLLLGVLVRSR